MKKTIVVIAFALALLLSGISAGAVTPLWMRDVQISPDGQRIAFCYKGDIFVVSALGGSAQRLTSGSSYEQTPVWSPDGGSIAFASDRFGNFDVFVMPSAGGNATRLTFNSTSELPTSFTPDGRNIIFTASIQAPATSIQFPRSSLNQLYSVPVAGGKTSQVLGTPAQEVCWSPDASFFLFQDNKGMESTWRKHHISSVTRDIWKYEPATGTYTNLTQRAGEDLDPVLSEDGKTVYILSEPSDGDGYPKPQGWQTSINVYSFALDNPKVLSKVSSFTKHPVRFLSWGGNKLCYSWNGEIYTQVPGNQAEKLSVDIVIDESNTPDVSKFSSGASSAVLSPDGRQIAFILHGEVFVSSVEYGTTKRITSTPQSESNVTFGRDNRTIAYDSDRNGVSQLYIASIARPEDPDFPNATVVDEKPFLPDSSIDRRSPKFSPDGKKLAFIEGRKRLMVADVETHTISQVTDGSQWFELGECFNYNWSPDGKWFTLEYVPNGHDPYYDIGLVSADGGEVTNITGSGYMSGDPSFVLDGNAILFMSDRYGMRSHASWGSQQDVFLCFLNQESYDRARLSKEDFELLKEAEKNKDNASEDEGKKKSKKGSKEESDKDDKSIVVELYGIEDRIVRITPNSSDLGYATLSKDGETLYYQSSFEGGYDLWKCELRDREASIVSKNSGSGRFATDTEGKEIFMLGSTFKKLDNGKLKNISYSAELKRDFQAEREYMFEYVYNEEKERFYDAAMHGVDWKSYVDDYRRFLPHISNNYDFSEMLSELLGELNVSHTGSGYSAGLKTEATAYLGLLFDMSYDGKGLKVAEVIKGGPFDHAGMNVCAGDIITHIDRNEITAEQDPSVLLMGHTNKKTLISVQGKDDVVVRPVSASTQNSLMYKRWVERQAKEVERLSNGRLGYVHIESMNDWSYRTIYSDILGKYNKCEGIVIDQRFNGGGRLHEDVEILFGGEKYLTQVVRGEEACDMPSRRWNKPSIMLQCECDYSNAHGTPWVYSHMKLGKLVGTPVPGTMTSVNWVDLLDDSMYFGIPVVGYRTAEGNYLENTQLMPDIYVENTPEKLVLGEDEQLKAAVEELLDEIDGVSRTEEKKLIALTFDDGPNTTVTPKVLDVLEQYGAKASFFLEGQFVDDSTAPVIKRMVELGCEIANHSKTHPAMDTLSVDAIRHQIEYTDSVISAVSGKTPKFFRPPYISVNQLMHDNIAHTFIAGVGCNDWMPQVTAEKRIELVLQNASDGQIVLLHDGDWNAPTPEVVAKIVPALIEQGYELVTVSELFERKGYKPKPHDGIVYSSVPPQN